jgi:penicillin-binding protein 1C
MPRKSNRSKAKQKKPLLIIGRFLLRHWKLELFIVLSTLLLGAFYLSVLKNLPLPTKLNGTSYPQSSQIYDRNGTLLYTIYADRNAEFIPLKDIPKTLQEATIAIEDKDFYRHGAVDVRGILRALLVTATHQNIQGGSTLTQQLVKNTLLTPEQTVKRKIKEVILSFAVEVLYSKNKILEMYLNQVPYGGTAYGVQAAAKTYFGKDARQLDLAQIALIAGMPEAPTTNSPYGTHPELAKNRQVEILKKMEEQHYITRNQEAQAAAEPLHYAPLTTTIKAPHFVLYVKDLLVKKYGQKMVEQGGLKVQTTLDLNLQNYAQDTVASEVAKIRFDHVSNGAALITRPIDGEILAMVGSKGYFDTDIDGNVNVTLSMLQPGSSIKPVNYAVGLLKGYTAATEFLDAPICFPDQGGAKYCPQNYDGKFHGLVQMRYALGNSFNIPAVKMLKANTVEAMVATASAMGITSFKDPSHYGLSLTLGGGETTMLQMATAYGVFANQGYREDLRAILSVKDSSGHILEKYDPPKSSIFGKKVLPNGVTFIMSHMLLDNNARLTEFGPSSELKIGNYPVSVKTGTTNDFRDNWTIGYTPSFVVTTWVGNNDHSPMNGLASGITGAAPIWNKIMSHLITGTAPQWPVQPEDVIGRNVCTTTGLLPSAANSCPTRYEYFIKGTEPRGGNVMTQKVFIDKSTGDLAKPGQTDNVEQQDKTVITDINHDTYCIDCPHPSPSPSPTPHP